MDTGHPRNAAAENDAVVALDGTTDDDWFGQDRESETDDAERALELAGADETRVEGVFEDIPRPPESDLMDLPADERPV